MKPNILFLFPDQHRGDWLPFSKDIFDSMGVEELAVVMPNLKKIMESGATFTKAHTPSPVCAPARACLASGNGYTTCGVMNNADVYDAKIPTFYNALKDNGYSVGGVGKFDLHKPIHDWGIDGFVPLLAELGFTHTIDNAGKFDAAHSGKKVPKDPYMALLHKHGLAEYHANDIETRGKGIEPTNLPDELYCDTYIGTNAVNMIDEFPKDRPWFLQVNFTGPHDPFDVTKSMRERFCNIDYPMPHNHDFNDNFSEVDHVGVRQNYAAMLENIDRQIGRMLQKIEELGQLENTVIIYSSDHGEMLGDYSRYGKSTYRRGATHIPMVIRPVGGMEPVINNSVVSLTDLAVTIAEFGGTKLDSADDSNSLIPIVEGKKESVREVMISALDNWSAKITDTDKIITIDGKPTYHFKSDDLFEDVNII